MLSLFHPKEKEAKWQIISRTLGKLGYQQVLDIDNFHEFLEKVFSQDAGIKAGRSGLLFGHR